MQKTVGNRPRTGYGRFGFGVNIRNTAAGDSRWLTRTTDTAPDIGMAVPGCEST